MTSVGQGVVWLDDMKNKDVLFNMTYGYDQIVTIVRIESLGHHNVTVNPLKGLRHEDFAGLAQFCAKIIT